MNTIPDNVCPSLQCLTQDGQGAVSYFFKLSMDTTDCLGRVDWTSMVLSHYAWFRSIGFSSDALQSLLNMPFTETHLFRDQVYFALERFKDSKATACSLGLTSPTQQFPQQFCCFLRLCQGIPTEALTEPASSTTSLPVLLR